MDLRDGAHAVGFGSKHLLSHLAGPVLSSFEGILRGRFLYNLFLLLRTLFLPSALVDQRAVVSSFPADGCSSGHHEDPADGYPLKAALA